MASERLQFVGVLLLSGVLFTASMGLGGSPAADEPDPKELVRDAVESTDTKSIEGVRTEVFQRDDQFEMATVAVTRQSPTRSRIEVLKSIENDERSDLTVINGSTTWRYFQDEQRAVRKQSDQAIGGTTHSFQGLTRTLLEQYQATYVGTDTVENRSTHVVELEPPEDPELALSLDVQAGSEAYEFELEEASEERWFVTQETLWIDTETAYPVKQRIEWTDQEGNVVASNIRTYHELTVGAEIDAEEAFEFDPPERAEVTGRSLSETHNYSTFEAATDAAGFSFPEPALPSGYELERATVQTLDEHQGLMLTYTTDGSTITVHASEGTTKGDGDRIVDTEIGDVNATLLSVDDRVSLAWDCNALSYRVSGVHDVDALASIADSIGCESSTSGDARPPGSIWVGPASP
jgi:outer membrane lipoprotein-sorting protein